MPAPESDDPARLTGPSHRGTGPGNRGTGAAGTTRTAQAPPSSPPRRDPPPRSTPKDLFDQVVASLEAASDERQTASAQAAASSIAMELTPFFRSRYARYGGPAPFRPGEPVPIVVLNAAGFAVELEAYRASLVEDERDLLTTYAPGRVSRFLSGGSRGPETSVVKVRRGTKLTPDQLELLLPSGPRLAATSTAGGFFSTSKKTIYLRADQVSVGAVAHELSHAYTSHWWSELQIALVLQRGTVSTPVGPKSIGEIFTLVDEGLASILAQRAIDDWYASPPARASAPKPATKPRGLVGYLPTVGVHAENFIGVIDGTAGSPRGNTLASFFGGQIRFTIDESVPGDSEVQFGRDTRRRLKEVLT